MDLYNELFPNQKLILYMKDRLDELDIPKTKLRIDRLSLPEERNIFFYQNIGLLLNYVIKRYYTCEDIEDYFQEGAIVFLNSIEKYDANSGFAFSSYLYQGFKNAMGRYSNNNYFSLNVGIGFKSLARKVNILIEDGYTDDEILEKTGTNDDNLYMVKTFIDANMTVSLDKEIRHDLIDMTTLRDLIPDSKNKINELINDITVNDIRETIFEKSGLSKKEKDVLKMRYYQNLTFMEIGKILNVSKQRAHEIHNQAIKKIRKNSSFNILKELRGGFNV